MENDGFVYKDIYCTSTPFKISGGNPYNCSNAFDWNSTDRFASPGTDSRTFTLYFPKTYVSVSKIQIKSGPNLRYLNASIIDSSLDGVNYKHVMNTNVSFCDNHEIDTCNCENYTVREYSFPEERILEYLRISGIGKDSCGTSELSFYGIELFGYFTSFCFSLNNFIHFSFPLLAYTHVFILL